MFQVDLDFYVNVTYALPPVAVVQVSDVYHHKSGITLYLPVLGYAIAACFFLLVTLWFLCRYCLKIEQVRLRLYGVIGRVEVGEILINREQPVQPEDDQPVDHPIWYIRTQGLQQSVIDSISIVKFKKNEWLVEGSDCSICLSEFEENESLRILPKCEHAFHVPCIDQWFKSHKNCPLCRAPVANVTVVDVPAEENDVGLEGQQSYEAVIAVVNTASQEDTDSSRSENGRYALATIKDSSFSESSESKPECDLAESHRIDEYEVPHLIRRSLSAGPVPSSNISDTVTDVKIHIDSDASAESGSSLVQRMKRSMSYGGKPSSVKSSRKQKSILPY